MRVLVTGATGFIGSYLVPALVDHDDDVVATDIVAEPRWITSRKGAESRREDLCRNPGVRELEFQARPDRVPCLAGMLIGACEETPSRGFQANLVARFVTTSLPAVLGRGPAKPGAHYPYASSFDDARTGKRIGWNPDHSIRRGFKSMPRRCAGLWRWRDVHGPRKQSR